MYDSSPTSFSCDYELSLLNAIREVFPATEIWGCYFHFSQNFRRNLGEVSFYFVFLRFIIPLLVWFISWSRQWSGISSSSTNVACIGICSWKRIWFWRMKNYSCTYKYRFGAISWYNTSKCIILVNQIIMVVHEETENFQGHLRMFMLVLWMVCFVMFCYAILMLCLKMKILKNYNFLLKI